MPAANSVGFSTNSSARGNISSVGAWTINAPSAGLSLLVNASTVTASTAVINGVAVGQAAIEFDVNSVLQGMIGFAGAANQIVTGSAAGDLVLRAQSGALRVALAGSAASQFLIDTTGTTNIADSLGTLFAAGYRGTPVNVQTGNYTPVLSDRGKIIHLTGATGTLTIPNSVFSAGDVLTVLGFNGTVAYTIAQGAGVTLFWAGSGLTGNRTLTSVGLCTIAFQATGGAVISGSGVS